MDRRRFIGATVVGGAGLAVTSSGCVSEDRGAGGGERAPEVDPFELDEATVVSLQERMESGDLSARAITEMYLERVEELDRQGPTLRAVIETNPEALEIADRLDGERRSNGTRGPLHGIPVMVKDNIDTHDRMTTTAGSLALEGSIPPRDSFIVQKLREAGAIILAKANMSEWAFFRGARATSGWSARGGQCRNPYALDRNPSGSSAGSAVAAAANMTALAVGTETGGSIVCPASADGVVGLKPTVGLWSRSGIIPISLTRDSAGPITRSVRDAAVLLGAATGVDPRDRATAESRGNAHTDYTRFLDPGGLEGARIGVARNFPDFEPSVLERLDEAVEVMGAQGAEVIDPVELPNAVQRGGQPGVVTEYEFKAGINAYFESLGPDAPVRSLSELIEFNRRHRDAVMPYFGQERLIAAQARGPLTDETYRSARRTAQRRAREEGIDALMDRHELDAIVAPTADPVWLTDHILGDRLGDYGYSARPAAIAGYPDISVPMGFVHGLPVGVSFFGRAWSEPTLLRLAYAYEQATNHRRVPEFLPTLG